MTTTISQANGQPEATATASPSTQSGNLSNIVNSSTGAAGYQVPGQPIPQGWTATPIAVDNLAKPATPLAISASTPAVTNTPSVAAPQGTTTGENGQAVPAENTTHDQIVKELSDLGIELQGVQKETLDPNLQTNATSAYNAYNQAKLDLAQKLNTMRTANPTGQFGTDVQAQIAKTESEGNANLANLAVVAQSTQGLLTDAQKTIDDKLTAQLQPIQDRIDFLTKFSTTNDADLTDTQKEQMTEKADQLKTEQAGVQTAAQNIHATLLKNAAPASAYSTIDGVMNKYTSGQISGTEAQSEMYAAASPFGVVGETDAASNLPVVNMTANGNPDPTSQSQFLASVTDPGLRTTIAGLANYTINPSSIATKQYKGSGQLDRQQVLSLVQQYDPTYNEAQWASRQSLLTNFESGQYSQNINSLNTAVGHLADIPKTFGTLGNTSIPALNYVKNGVGGIFGFGAPQGAGLNINAATGELASTFKGGGATDSEIGNLGTLGTNSSPSQVKNYVQTAVNLLGSRLSALQATYTSGMGKPPASSFISPANMTQLSTLKNNGYDVNIPGVYYTDPNAFLKADTNNASALSNVRSEYPNLTPAQALQYTQYLQENGQ